MANDNTPLYQRIADEIRDQILSGVLSAGQRLPTRRELMGEKNTTRSTIDKVMDALKREGLVASLPRQGMVVADLSGRGTGLDDRAASLRATGRALAKNETSRIFSVGMEPCPEKIAHYLGVEPGQEVLCRARVTSKDNRPVALSRSYYPPEVSEVTPELAGTESIPSGSRELAAKRMGGTQGKAEQQMTARLATGEELELLELGTGDIPVSQVMRVVPLTDGRMIEVAVKVQDGKRPVAFRTNMGH